MITTVDGKEKYTGKYCWVMWYSSLRNQYEPKRALFDSFTERLQWHSRELCQEQCDLMNQEPKTN